MQVERIKSLDALRGIAASSVVLFHFTNSNSSFLSEGILKFIGRFGFLGVVMFFVISGFVLCNSLLNFKYKLKHFPIFIAKRLIRLEPPYVFSILLVITLNFISEKSSIYHGSHHNYDILSIFSHLGYLSDLFGFRWLNPVYWTLGIEFQFYILLALIFPYLISNSKSFFVVFILSLTCCFIFDSDKLIFKYLPYFFLGIIVCLFFKSKISKNIFFAYFIILLLYICFLGEGIFQVVTCLSTVVLIFWPPIGENLIFNFLGKISYSLYLIHIPIGLRVINFGARYSHDNFILQIVILVLAVIICLFFSLIVYHFIEKPTIAFSKKIIFKS